MGVVQVNQTGRQTTGGDFAQRHIGPDAGDVQAMLEVVGCDSIDDLIASTIPESIRLSAPLDIPSALGEFAAVERLKETFSKNRVFRSCIGMGYHDCIVPPVIQRNILENPGWYTQYTPYQAEIAQGRLEALINFQTMIADLTALPIANASLLDEPTAAAEAMSMCYAAARFKKKRFIVASNCHPQTIGVVQSRAASLGIVVDIADITTLDLADADDVCGVLAQYPCTYGSVDELQPLADRVHACGALFVVAADLLALTLIKAPGEFGADIAVGSAQRFGVPMGAGGPHAAYMSAKESLLRRMPGRIVGISKDAEGRPAYRTAIQTREQHIKRERATSNICTAQALLAIMSSMYAVYHGPDGLRRIADRIHRSACTLAEHLRDAGHAVEPTFFDTLCVMPAQDPQIVIDRAVAAGINLRRIDEQRIGIALDETVDDRLLEQLLRCFAPNESLETSRAAESPLSGLERASGYLTHPVFNKHRSETEMLRYIFALQQRDLSLAHAMIPLGSCTMKLNATTEMLPVSWPEVSRIHPFAPDDQMRGYSEFFRELETWLGEITGLPAVSLQPNAGSQGEYAGLMVIRAYHAARGEEQRDVCLIPTSAHGTNPASAVIAGMRVVAVQCDERGDIDLDDLRTQVEKHAGQLGALMITYPSTHGVFEHTVNDVCRIVHDAGGQVYLDGANMNAQVGLCRPAEIGADVCHLNLHKTFCIPHGGGGPGMGPICAAPHLAPFMPGHPITPPDVAGAEAIGAISGAPYGSASILPISWMYIALMGETGLRHATEIAILNANYMAARLNGHYDILFTGTNGRVAHEFIVDCRPFEKSADIRIDDIAKRLIDYGFHAPTMAWPVAGTLMIEPTESESKEELDRFCDAMIAIREEVRAIEEGRAPREDNVLVNAPHTVDAVASDTWNHVYSRKDAAFPKEWVRAHKFWPPVARVDNAWGDRNLHCTCSWDDATNV